MDSVTDILIVIIIAIGFIGAVAYFLEKRWKEKTGETVENRALPPENKFRTWLLRGAVAIMMLSIIGYFVLKLEWLIYVTLGVLLFMWVLGKIMEIADGFDYFSKK